MTDDLAERLEDYLGCPDLWFGADALSQADLCDTMRQAATSLRSQAEEIKRLSEALEPFANIADSFKMDGDFDVMLLVAEPGDTAHFAAEEFRRARTALRSRNDG